jgi:hypothetical protein
VREDARAALLPHSAYLPIIAELPIIIIDIQNQLKVLQQAVLVNSAQIAANSVGIQTNTNGVASNGAAISMNAAGVDANKSAFKTFLGAISSLHTAMLVPVKTIPIFSPLIAPMQSFIDKITSS